MDQEKKKVCVRRMTAGRAVLVKRYPFFGHLLMRLQFACAPCGTACTDGKHLIFDPEFAVKLTDQEMQFVMLHEVLHCALNHICRTGGRNRTFFNIACDIVANSSIMEMLGVQSFAVAGEEVMHLAPDGREGACCSAEEVYRMLLQAGGDAENAEVAAWASAQGDGKEEGRRGETNPDTEGKEALGSGKEGDSGRLDTSVSEKSREGKYVSRMTDISIDGHKNEKAGNDINRPGRGKGEPDGDLKASEQESKKGRGSGRFDRHDLWEKIEDADRMKDLWDENIREAAKLAGSGGSDAAMMRRLEEKLTRRTRRDWRQILYDFISRDDFDYSWCPPDRRFWNSDFLMPAYQEDEDQNSVKEVWVCVDTSGSMDSSEITECMSEVLCAVEQAGLKGMLSFFDHRISEPKEFTDESELKNIVPVGGGGTSFSVIFSYMREHMAEKLPRAILIFTDGYAPVPEERESMQVPVLWIITKGGRAEMTWGEVIRLD